MTDPVAEFEHDHIAFSHTVAELKALLAGERDEDVSADLTLLRTVDALRDDLLAHFAKEEEGLFPFVVRVLPDVAAAVEQLLAGHDIVCGCLARVAHAVNTSTALHREAPPALFARFERAYAEHARAEVQVLRSVGDRLDGAQRSELRELIRGL